MPSCKADGQRQAASAIVGAAAFIALSLHVQAVHLLCWRYATMLLCKDAIEADLDFNRIHVQLTANKFWLAPTCPCPEACMQEAAQQPLSRPYPRDHRQCPTRCI